MAERATSGHVARNRKARRDYAIEDRFEAGIVLTGAEVKALRAGRVNIDDAFARERAGELWLEGCHIPPYGPAARAGHEPLRTRKLLLHRRQIQRLTGQVARAGYTLVPLSLYFNRRGVAKLELGLGKGRRAYDKRAQLRDRDWRRQKERLRRSRR